MLGTMGTISFLFFFDLVIRIGKVTGDLVVGFIVLPAQLPFTNSRHQVATTEAALCTM